MADADRGKTDRTAILRWAVEQAVALHSRSGVTTDVLLAEARKIADFAEPEDRKTEAG